MITANAEMITTITTGVVSIVAAIIAFAASCKSGNNVTKQAKSDLQLEHKDLKDTLQLEQKNLKYTLQREHQSLQSSLQSNISSSQSSVENKVNSVKEIINVEIAKSEERRKNLTPEQVTINKVAEQIKDMHSNWLESNAKIKILEEENAALCQRIFDLENNNKKLHQQLEKSKNEIERFGKLNERYEELKQTAKKLETTNSKLLQKVFVLEEQVQGSNEDEENEP